MKPREVLTRKMSAYYIVGIVLKVSVDSVPNY